MTQPSGLAGYARLLLAAPIYAQGWQETVVVPQPAAGAGWSYTVDGRFHERLLAVRWALVTDAVVANRFPQLALADQLGNRVVQVPAAGTVVAGTTVTMSLMTGAPSFASSATGTAPGFLPDVLAPPGWRWFSTATGYDPGDQDGQVTMLVQRFPSDITRIDAAG